MHEMRRQKRMRSVATYQQMERIWISMGSRFLLRKAENCGWRTEVVWKTRPSAPLLPKKPPLAHRWPQNADASSA